MKRVKTVFWIVLFISCLTIMYSWFYDFMKNTAWVRDTKKPFDKFYEVEKDTLDAIFVGSSHVYCDINPVIIWNEQGIPSYDLAMGGQPVIFSYYNIKESLLYQHPKVLIFETYLSLFYEKPNWGTVAVNTLGLKFSQNKIDALYAATDGSWGKILSSFWGMPIYHSLNDIFKEDLIDNSENTPYMNGFTFSKAITVLDKPDVAQITGIKKLEERKLEYLLKIIKLAKEENIKLLLITSPFAISSEYQEIFNSIRIIAQQNNVDYINYNLLYDELDLNFETDLIDEGHLNYHGAAKLSKHLARYLHDVYGLEDRRGDGAYASWNVWAQECMKEMEKLEKTTVE
jgi:hypothetical protein